MRVWMKVSEDKYELPEVIADSAAYIYLHIGKKYEAQTKYDAKNTVKVTMKLNKTTDEDILNALSMQASKQGYIKRLIREDLAKK